MIRPRLYNFYVPKFNRDITLPTSKTVNMNKFKSRHNLKIEYPRTFSRCAVAQYDIKTKNGQTEAENTLSSAESHFSSLNDNCSYTLHGALYPLTATEPLNSPKNPWRYSHPVNTVSLLCSANHSNQVSFRKLFGTRQYSTSVPVDPQTVALTGLWKVLSECAPVQFTQESLVWLHAETGLPWWATIILTTVTARGLMTLPLAIFQHYNMSKVENLKEEMNELVEELKSEMDHAVRKFRWSEKYAMAVYKRSLKQQWNKLIIRENCHPMKGTILVFVQLPMWVILSTALRNICYMLPHGDISAQITFMELTMGGFGWIPNLTEVDHSLILPVTLGILNLSIIEIQAMLKVKESTKFQRYLTNFFRLLSIAMIPIAATVPSCISLYWVSSSAFGFFQNLILLSPKVRRMTGIPHTQSERANPYHYLLQTMRRRLGLSDSVESAKKT